MIKKKSYLFLFLISSLLFVTLCSSPFNVSANNDPRIHEPLVSLNEALSTRQETIWSSIYFGHYPASEIVKSDWDSVDSYAIRDGDVIRDDELYTRLCEAEWTDDRLSLDGQDYIRINRTDAVTAASDREQHYRWDDPDEWHYFVEEPIKWRILSLKGDEALLLSDRILDCFPFNQTDEKVGWYDSSVRSWLNGYDSRQNLAGEDYSGNGFLDNAFTTDERGAMIRTTCVTPDNQDYGTDCGPDTQDYVFLLSNEEVFADAVAADYGFYAGRGYDDPAKRFLSTTFAKCRGTWWSPVEPYRGNSFWFMRTSGYTPYNVSYICDFGYIYSRGTAVTCDDAGILPAIRIDLSAADIVYAGEVSSADIIKDPLDADGEQTYAEKVQLRNPMIEADDSLPGGIAVTWDTVAFGSYPQTEILEKGNAQNGSEADPVLFHKLQTSDWNGNELVLDGKRYKRVNNRFFRFDPIIWRVLEVTEDSALLLTAQVLDCFPYYHELTDVHWDQSEIRSWLNGLSKEENLSGTDYSGEGDSFWSTAFSANERLSVMKSYVRNSDNHYFGTSCGPDTVDRVFLLSENETFSSPAAASFGFLTSDAQADPAKRFTPTAYAVSRGVWQSKIDESAGNAFWFLRSNGYTASNVVYVGELGHIYNRGIPVICPDAGLIPAMRIDLETAEYIYTGTTSSRPR